MMIASLDATDNLSNASITNLTTPNKYLRENSAGLIQTGAMNVGDYRSRCKEID